MAQTKGNFVRLTLSPEQRDLLAAYCNDELAGVTDISSPEFSKWYELRNKLVDAAITEPVKRTRRTKAEMEAAACEAPGAPLLQTPSLAVA